MSTYVEVYTKWVDETHLSHESSALFDADKMIDDFDEIVPAFFFRFVWDCSRPCIHMHIRCAMIATNDSYVVDTSDKLCKYFDKCNLNNFTFHQHLLEPTLPKWWKEVLTVTEISDLKRRRERVIEQVVKNVVSDLTNEAHNIKHQTQSADAPNRAHTGKCSGHE